MRAAWILSATIALSFTPFAQASTGKVAKRIKAANPASADGARTTISLLHAALLQPPSEITTEVRGLCGRFLPTAVTGMKRGHVATCALQADAYEALATCALLNGKRQEAERHLATRLALLDCPAEGVDGVRRATKLAAAWHAPEMIEPVVFKQRAALQKRPDATARSKRALEMNLRDLAESRRQRRVVTAAVGKRPRTGLLVLGTQGGTSSAKAGLRRDDVLILAGATPVRGLRQVSELSVKAATTPLTVMRAGKPLQLVLRGALTGLDATEVPPTR